MKLVHPISLVVFISLSSLLPPADAQETITIPRADYDALKQQAEAARQLQTELDQVKAELARLRQLAPEARGSQIVNTPTATNPDSRQAVPPQSVAVENTPAVNIAVVANPTGPWTPLPAIDATAVLNVSEVIQHFAQNPPAATEFYDGRKLKLHGVITAFDKPALRRDFEIVFRTAAGQLVCRIAPPERFTAVFTTRSGAVLTGRTERGTEIELLKIGDAVSMEGTGQGIKDGSIRFIHGNVMGLK